jgi:hypothetical protein
MDALYDIPLIMGGREEKTIRKEDILDYKGKIIGKVSVASTSFVSLAQGNTKKAYWNFRKVSIDKLLSIYADASDEFVKDVSIGGHNISYNEFCRLVTLSTGLPISVTRRAMQSLQYGMKNMKEILAAQTPEGDLRVYDTGICRRNGIEFTYLPRWGENIGCNLPENHPSVAIVPLMCSALKIPLVNRSSFGDTFTYHRVAKSLYDCGLLENTLFSVFTEHSAVSDLLTGCSCGITFGAERMEKMYQNFKNIKVFGPGRSKILGLGMQGMIDEISRKIAENLVSIEPVDPLEEKAQVAAINPIAGKYMDDEIKGYLDSSSVDVTQKLRKYNSRLITVDDVTYLLPTLIKLESFRHQLFGREYPFQFATIVEVPKEDLSEIFSERTLVLSITDDPDRLIDLSTKSIVTDAGRGCVNLSSVVLTDEKKTVDEVAEKMRHNPKIKKVFRNKITCDIDLTQPHEDHLTTFLYEARGYS